MTCWRRLHAWVRAGVWQRVHEAILRRLREHDQIMWDRACVDAASVPAPAGGEHTGRNPTDRGKLGSKHHLLVVAQPIVEIVELLRQPGALRTVADVHANPQRQLLAHQAAIRHVAAELELSPEAVAYMYCAELLRLGATAAVTDFLAVITTKRIRSQLRSAMVAASVGIAVGRLDEFRRIRKAVIGSQYGRHISRADIAIDERQEVGQQPVQALQVVMRHRRPPSSPRPDR